MPTWRQQAFIEAPVEEVWSAVGDPARYPEWAAHIVSVTGLPEVARGAEFKQITQMPVVGETETTFRIEELEDLRMIKLRCQTSGYYGCYLLTEAQSSTFVDVEVGVDPTAVQYRLAWAAMGKRQLRRITEEQLDGLRELLARRVSPR